MLDVPAALLAERQRLGLDLFDEMWEGELHMVPPPSAEHHPGMSRSRSWRTTSPSVCRGDLDRS
jgi:hypothetical protein